MTTRIDLREHIDAGDIFITRSGERIKVIPKKHPIVGAFVFLFHRVQVTNLHVWIKADLSGGCGHSENDVVTVWRDGERVFSRKADGGYWYKLPVGHGLTLHAEALDG